MIWLEAVREEDKVVHAVFAKEGQRSKKEESLGVLVSKRGLEKNSEDIQRPL